MPKAAKPILKNVRAMSKDEISLHVGITLVG